MIYYPMSVLMNAGIRDILIISTPQDTPRLKYLLGDGHQFGINLTYAVLPSPDGLAQAFIIGADFIGIDTMVKVLGDNIFAGHGLKKRLKAAVENAETGKGASLNVELLGQGFTWLDTGTHESLVEATNYVKTTEQHQHRKIAGLKKIAYVNGWINRKDILAVYEVLKKNQNGQYLKDILDGKYLDMLH